MYISIAAQRDGCPKIVNLGTSKTDLFYEVCGAACTYIDRPLRMHAQLSTLKTKYIPLPLPAPASISTLLLLNPLDSTWTTPCTLQRKKYGVKTRGNEMGGR